MTPDLQPIRNLVSNAWAWSLFDFARETGMNPQDEETQFLFLQLRTAADCLRQLDDRVMGIVATRKAVAAHVDGGGI